MTKRILGAEKSRIFREKNTGSDNRSWKWFGMKLLALEEGFQKLPKLTLPLNGCRKYAEMGALDVPVHPHYGFVGVHFLRNHNVFQRK